jgi:hypothetical protein
LQRPPQKAESQIGSLVEEGSRAAAHAAGAGGGAEQMQKVITQ